MMDFFLSKPETTITPSSISYFAIYDPTTFSQESETETVLTPKSLSQRGVLVLQPQSPNTDVNSILRRVGLLQGMTDFVKGYSSSDESLQYVQLDNQQIVVGEFESRYKFVLSVMLGKVEGKDEEEKIEYSSSDVMPLALLIKWVMRGYDAFRLHNGSMESICGSMDGEEVSMFLNKWWDVWLENLGLQIEEDGFLKMFDSVRRSRVRVDSEIKGTLDSLKEKHDFKECLIWCNDKNNYEDYGLVYEHTKMLTADSKRRLLQWLAETDHYGLTPQTLSQPVVPKKSRRGGDREGDHNEQIYDPFKMVWSTLGDVSKATGITAGVDAGFKTIAEGVNLVGSGVQTMNSFVPWWGSRGKSSRVSVSDAVNGSESQRVSESAEEERAYSTGHEVGSGEEERFLIGRVGDTVVFKNVCLELDADEKLHRLVLFQYHEFVVVLVYDFSVNTLNDASYYDDLFLDLRRMAVQHLPELSDETKNFYFSAYDKARNILEANLSNIPVEEDDDDANNSRFHYDLSISRMHSLILHQTILTTMDFNKRDKELEKLVRTRNGWWVYNHKSAGHDIVIVKKWKLFKSAAEHRNNLLESSANVVASIGPDAKAWLDNYLELHPTGID